MDKAIDCCDEVIFRAKAKDLHSYAMSHSMVTVKNQKGLTQYRKIHHEYRWSLWLCKIKS